MIKKEFTKLVPHIRVAILGDFILDEYIWGETKRISPEAPVPVVRMTGSEVRLGGAANVVNNVSTLGAISVPISVVGDQQGWKLVAELDEMDITTNQIVQSITYKNSHKIRVVSSSQQMVRLDNEDSVKINDQDENAIIENIEYTIPRVQALVISDYKKGVLTKNVMRRAISLANEHGIPVIIDPKGKDYSIYKGATVITPNESELELATGIPVDRTDPDTLQLAAMVLIKKLSLEALILTQSEEGMTIFFRDGSSYKLSSQALEVYDVTGAGDTVVATLACALACGMTLEESCHLASDAAAVVVGKVGTATCSTQELLSEFPKVKTEADMMEEIKSAKQKGKTVVFTNGCFDLLHSGHVKLLQKAKTYGDILVVGINSDESVRSLKGPTRPCIQEDERAHLLAALNCVDYVTIFHSETPAEIITKIRPDVLVKGRDYEGQDIVGSDVAGKTVLVDLVGGKSTTNIIQKIQDSTADK